LWLPEYAIRYLAQNAPDFFDWNSGLYVFKTPESERSFLLQASLDRLDEEIREENLSKEEKRHREAYLKSLLEEYGGDSEFDQKARTDVLIRLAHLYAGRGSYEPARQLAQKAVALSQKTKDWINELVAWCQLAMIALRQGDYEEALEAYEEALRLDRESVIAWNGKGNALRGLDRYEEALEAYEEALRLDRESVIAWHGLASIALKQGDYEAAEPLSERALAIREEALGAEHPRTAVSLNNLAVLYQSQGRYEAAEPLYERALAISEEALGKAHPQARTVAQSYITLLHEMGRAPEADALGERFGIRW
jgi:tetratricopeptide (TPR) repeat protein